MVINYIYCWFLKILLTSSSFNRPFKISNSFLADPSSSASLEFNLTAAKSKYKFPTHDSTFFKVDSQVLQALASKPRGVPVQYVWSSKFLIQPAVINGYKVARDGNCCHKKKLAPSKVQPLTAHTFNNWKVWGLLSTAFFLNQLRHKYYNSNWIPEDFFIGCKIQKRYSTFFHLLIKDYSSLIALS